MAIEQPNTDYTNRDYNSLLVSMLDLAAQKLPEWTDRSENDLGRLLLELFAYTGDVLLYYQDRIANEAFLSTAVERRSVIDLLSLIGYTLSTPAPATAKLTVIAPNPKVNAVRIEVGAKFATKSTPGRPAVEFIYYPLTSNSLALESALEEGKPLEFNVINAVCVGLEKPEEVGISNGSPYQRFRLTQTPILLPRDLNLAAPYLRIEVSDSAGFVEWELKNSLLNSLSTEQHYIVRINENDGAEIVFGDGKYGRIPPYGSKVQARYLIGGGSIGNVAANTITEVKSGVQPAIKVTNNAAASGGAEHESIEHARFHAPQVFRSQHRAVTKEDYVALAEAYPGVAKAMAVAPSWNYVDVYVVPEGGGDPNDNLLTKLKLYFEDYRMVTVSVDPRPPQYVDIYIEVSIGIDPLYYDDDVLMKAEAAVRDLFVIQSLSFGQTFYLSKIYEAVESIAGVEFAEVTSFQRIKRITSRWGIRENPVAKIALSAMEFPCLKELNIMKSN